MKKALEQSASHRIGSKQWFVQLVQLVLRYRNIPPSIGMTVPVT